MPYVGRDLSRGNYLKLDDLVSQFNGSTTTFNLTSGGSAFFPGSAFSILVSLGGIVQEPESAYTINKSQITFASAPLATDEFFIVALGVALGVGVPAHGTVGGSQLTKPLDYDDYFYLDSANNRVGIHSSVPTVALDVIGDIKLNGSLVTGGGGGFNAGVVTCTGLDVNGNGDISGTLTVGGNVSIGGTLTYLDVSNIDSVGIITAQQGIHLGAASTVGHLSTVGVSSIASLQVRDLTATHIAYAGANGRLTGSSNITYDGTTFAVAEPSQFSDNVFINVRGKSFKTSDWNIFNTTSGNALAISGGAAATEKIRIDNGGHVGIGTIPNDVDSIGKALNIGSSTGGAIYLQDNDAPTTKFGAISYNGVTAALQIHAHHASSYIDLGTNGTERVRINDSGYVGINTNVMSNAERLAVQLGNDEMFELRSAAQELFQVWKEGSTEECRINVKHGGSTKIHLRGNGVSYFNGGNLGIGNNAPAKKLHVTSSGEIARFTSTNSSCILRLYSTGSTSTQLGHTGDFFVSVGDKERFRVIGSNGRIGIGTDTAPRDMVHIHNPTANSSSYVQFTNANTGGTGSNDGTIIGISQNNSNTDGTGSGFTILQKENAELTLGTNGTEKLRITSTGNVGINDDNPSSQLVVKATSDDNPALQLYRQSTGGDIASIIWKTGSGDQAKINYRGAAGASEGLQFYTAGGSSSQQRMIIDLSGRVGIGTDDPGEKLDVEGSLRLRAGGNWTTYATRITSRLDSTHMLSLEAYHNSSTPVEVLGTYADSGGSNMRTVIAANGMKVGIGTDDPDYNLEVIGSFAATTKSFVINHPTKENHQLRYACLEGPENSVYVRGRSSDSVIELPNYWVGLVHDDSITVNVTPIGNKNVWVESINNNSVTIGSDDSTEYFYTVFAERKDVEKLEVEVEN